jgi:ATP-dependent exoDNAse (exonuclease V) alpha subunit
MAAMSFKRIDHSTRSEKQAQNDIVKTFSPEERQSVVVEGVCVHRHLLDSGWGFGTVMLDNKTSLSFVGTLGGELYDGARVKIHGFWSSHAKYGWQVKVRALEVMLATSQTGVQAWFQDRFPDVGPVRAKSMLDTFADKLWHIVEHDHKKLAEAPQIGDVLAERIHHTFMNYKHEREAYVYLAGIGLSPDAIRKAVNLWGRDTQKMIAEDPYILTHLPGIGFKQADRIARQAGVKAVDPRRILAGYTYAMEVLEREGSTCATPQKIMATAASQDVLNLQLATVRKHFDAAVESGSLIGEFGAYFRGPMANAEHNIAMQVGALITQGRPHV